MIDVRTWLAGIGLGQYADAFEANDVEMDLLKDVDDQTLKDIGVTSAGHRLRLRKRSPSWRPHPMSKRMRTGRCCTRGGGCVRRTPPAHRDVLRPGGFDGTE